MYDMIRAVRGAGFRTALLSNSWGCDEYPRADFPGLFDAVVISGECGMRKPEQAIFLHAAKCLGLAPEQCVFIDDMEANVAAAAACGMTGVHHTEAAQTVAALQDLLGVPLNGARHRPRNRSASHWQHDAITQGRGDIAGLACQAWRTTRIPPARAGRRT